MKIRYVSALATSLFLLSCFIASAQPTLNYQGRLTAGGTNYTGSGYFKFLLLNGDNEGVWSNDGTSEPGIGEPAGSVQIDVNNGLFNIELGDSSIGGMTEEISPLAFHEWALSLRTWFSTDNIAFEQLSPDVEIQPMDFAHINTGNMVIVDDDGTADFNDIQEAINFVSSNNTFNAVYIMPGGYEVTSPLTFPANNRVDLRGMGRQWVSIYNTNGAAVRAGDAEMVNIQMRGDPAITDVGSPTDYFFRLIECDTERMNAGGPSVALSATGWVNCFRTDFGNREGGNGVELSGNADMDAKNCSFGANGEGQHALVIRDDARCNLESCEIGSDGGLSFLADNGSGNGEFSQCKLYGGVVISNGMFGANFQDCRIDNGLQLFGGNNSGMNFRECSFGDGDGVRPVSIIGRESSVWFRNCTMHTVSNTTFYVEDSTGEIYVRDCEIHSDSGSAIEIIASSALPPDSGVGIDCLRSRILNYSYSDTVTDKDAIVVSNAPGNPDNDTWAWIDLTDCEVWGGIRDGIYCNSSEIEVSHSSGVTGQRNGVLMEGGNISLFSSEVTGEAGDGISLSGEAFFWIDGSDISGGEDGYGRGLSASMAGEGSAGFLLNSVASSDTGPALDWNGGKYICNGSLIMSGSDMTARLSTTNTVASFNDCRFFSYGDFIGLNNTNAAIVLSDTTAVPTPRITSCLLEPSTNATYAIDIQGGATTGNVVMVNSTMTRPPNPSVGMLPPTTVLSYGNYVLPAAP